MGGRREEGKTEGSPVSSAPCPLVAQVLRLVEAQATHFQQGHEELGRLAQYRRELGAQVGPRWRGGTGGGGRGGGSGMSGLAWLGEAGGHLKCPLRYPVAPAGPEFGAREEGHGAETRAAEAEGEGGPQDAEGPGALASARFSCLLTLLCPQELGGEEPEPSLKEGPGGLVMEGHLFKRASNAFKTWSR